MIPITVKLLKLVAFELSATNEKNGYPVRRAIRISEELANEATVVFITAEKNIDIPETYRVIQASNHRDLLNALSFLKPDVLIRDIGNTILEEAEAIQRLVPSVLHFDDFGEGGQAADFVIQTLYGISDAEVHESHTIGIETFLPDLRAEKLRKSRSERVISDPPSLLIAFGETDPGNLTFRALRHVMNLQIPLSVTILLGSSYTHDASALQMMALSRRHTVIRKPPYEFLQLASESDIVLCGGGYMPYDVASLGIPCIVLAQNTFESELQFPSDKDGFTHLGLGRKVKQSNLLNAIMEPLLHDTLRKRDMDRQLALPLGSRSESVFETIRYLLNHPRRSHSGQPVSDVIN